MVSMNNSDISQCSIVDFCTDIFMFVTKVRETENLGDPLSLRNAACRCLNEFVENCRDAGVKAEIIQNALYALVALVDETVMGTPGPYRDSWSLKLLQIEYFGENLAGTQFYSRLRAAMMRGQGKTELLEIFFLCLALGFEGMYKIDGSSKRIMIFEELGILLRRLKGRTQGFISPEKLVSDCVDSERKRISTVWLAAGAGLFLLFIVSITMHLRYSAVISDVLNLINAL